MKSVKKQQLSGLTDTKTVCLFSVLCLLNLTTLQKRQQKIEHQRELSGLLTVNRHKNFFPVFVSVKPGNSTKTPTED